MNIEDSLIIIFAASILYVSVTSRLEAYIKALAFQGFLLFVLSIFFNIPSGNFLTVGFIVFETFFLKMIVIPLYLRKMIRDNEILRETEPYIPNLYSLIIVSLFTAVGFLFAYVISKVQHPVNPMYFGVSISTIMSGLFIIMTRKKLITHVIGYIFMENGIFLLSLSMAGEMPVIVNLGVALDIFIWALLAGVFLRRMQGAFPDQDIDKLKGLRG
jgi:hydrogenase-4 component E